MWRLDIFRIVKFSWFFMNMDGMIYSGTVSSGTIFCGHPACLKMDLNVQERYNNCSVKVAFYHFDGLTKNLLISF